MLHGPGGVDDLRRPSEGLGAQAHAGRLMDTGGDANGRIAVARIDGPSKGGPQVRNFRLYEQIDQAFLGTAILLERRFGPVGEVGRLPATDDLALGALSQALLGELADSLEHPVAQIGGDALNLKQRLADKGVD